MERKVAHRNVPLGHPTPLARKDGRILLIHSEKHNDVALAGVAGGVSDYPTSFSGILMSPAHEEAFVASGAWRLGRPW